MAAFPKGDERRLLSPGISRFGRLLKKSAKWVEAKESLFMEQHLDPLKKSFYRLDITNASPEKEAEELVSKCTSTPVSSLCRDGMFSTGSGNAHQNHSKSSEPDLGCLTAEESEEMLSFRSRHDIDHGYCNTLREVPESGLGICAIRRHSQTTVAGKGRTRSANPYIVWNSVNRKEIYSICKHLPRKQRPQKVGELWRALPEKEKCLWAAYARRLTKRNQACPPSAPGTVAIPGSVLDGSSWGGLASSLEKEHVAGIAPIDAAAHLKLLGDGLTVIGENLLLNDCVPSVEGAYSVLLDSLLCSLAALLCLSKEIRGMEHLPGDVFKKTLDHVAYFLPGL